MTGSKRSASSPPPSARLVGRAGPSDAQVIVVDGWVINEWLGLGLGLGHQALHARTLHSSAILATTTATTTTTTTTTFSTTTATAQAGALSPAQRQRQRATVAADDDATLPQHGVPQHGVLAAAPTCSTPAPAEARREHGGAASAGPGFEQLLQDLEGRLGATRRGRRPVRRRLNSP